MNQLATMTVKEMADAIKCSYPKALELTKQKGFPVILVGRKRLIPVDAFKRWLDDAGKKEHV